MSKALKTIAYVLMFLMIAPTIIQQLHTQYSALLTPKTQVGVVEIGQLTQEAEVMEPLRAFFEQPDIKAILLKIDSPGGAAGTAQLIFQEIIALKKQYLKPVIVLVENMCASGGYYVATAADYIIAPPSACIGSIGAYIAYPNVKKLLDTVHVQYKVVAAGTYKLALNPFTEQTAEQDALIAQITNDTYERFVEDVATQRNLSINEANTWADGRVFTGRQAVKLGLIDEIGSLTTVEKYLRDHIPVEGKIAWVVADKKNTIAKMLGLSLATGIAQAIQTGAQGAAQGVAQAQAPIAC